MRQHTLDHKDPECTGRWKLHGKVVSCHTCGQVYVRTVAVDTIAFYENWFADDMQLEMKRGMELLREEGAGF